MKVENLIVGQVYKYKEICELIGIEPKTGNTKIKQLKELATLVDYEKQGTKFLIKEIFEEAKEKVDMRKVVKEDDKRRLGNNNAISTHIQYNLVCLLERTGEPTEVRGVGFNRYQLYRDLGMANEKFGNAFMDKKSFAENHYASEQAVIECFDYTYQRLYARLDSAFESYMKKSSGFTITKGYKITTSDGEVRVADKIEEGMIADIEDLVLQQFGLKNKRDLIFVKKGEESKYAQFKSTVISKLKEEFSIYFEDLVAYSDAFVFAYTLRAVKRVKARMEKDYGLNEETAREELNKLLLSSLDETIENRHKNTKDKYKDYFGEIFFTKDNMIDKYRLSEEYIDEQKRLKNTLVKIKTEQVTVEDYMKNKNEEIPF